MGKAAHRQKEEGIRATRDKLLGEGSSCRDELERMRANAVAASNYVTFARDNFSIATDQRKREIAHALGIKYTFYGREKQIALELNPLLVETVKFMRQVETSLALTENAPATAYTKEKTGDKTPVLSFGGPKEIRTPDLFHAMEARYQLCYGPVHLY